jgi:hypothetical protein
MKKTIHFILGILTLTSTIHVESAWSAVRIKTATETQTSSEATQTLCERTKGLAQHLPATCSWTDETGVPFEDSVDAHCSCTEGSRESDRLENTCIATKRWKCSYNEDQQ